MAIWDRIGGAWRTAALLGVGLAGGAAAVAVATVPDSGGVIHACVTTSDSGGNAPITSAPNLTVIDPDAGQSCAGSQKGISWNVTGPQGPPGQTGPQGPPGQTGQSGQTGASGGPAGTGTVIYNLVAPTLRSDAPGVGVAKLAGPGTLRFPILSISQVAGKAVGGAGRATGYDISLSKALDSSSPQLHAAVSAGKVFSSGTIVLYRSTSRRRIGRPGVTLKLRNVEITSIQTSSSKSGASPLETLVLTFERIIKISK